MHACMYACLYVCMCVCMCQIAPSARLLLLNSTRAYFILLSVFACVCVCVFVSMCMYVCRGVHEHEYSSVQGFEYAVTIIMYMHERFYVCVCAYTKMCVRDQMACVYAHNVWSENECMCVCISQSVHANATGDMLDVCVNMYKHTFLHVYMRWHA